MANQQYYATGKRKTSTARVFLRTNGSGKVTVNKVPLDEYFCRETDKMVVLQPLDLLDLRSKFDFYITVQGGGTTGQAGAIRHGISKALVVYDDSTTTEVSDDEALEEILSVRKQLRKSEYKLLTRDPRMVERKKFGLRKSRKRPQFSKR